MIARGIDSGKIFIDPFDYNSFIGRLGKIVVDTGAEILAWCLLPNHFHLLLKTGDKPLSLLMRRLLTGHAISFNQRHNRNGHLFQNRYKSIACQDDVYLLQLIRYIHLNPLKALLVKSIRELDNYPHSSHQILIGNKKLSWHKADDTLFYFGKSIATAKNIYLRFLNEGLENPIDLERGGPQTSSGLMENLSKENLVFDERILGDSAFVDKLLQIELFKDKIQPHVKMTVEELIKQVSCVLKITSSDLKGSKRTKASTEARAAISFLGVEYFGLKGAAIAKELKVSKACVSRLIPRGRAIVESKELTKIVTY